MVHGGCCSHLRFRFLPLIATGTTSLSLQPFFAGIYTGNGP